MRIEALFDLAFAEHQAGDLTDAHIHYQQVLQAQPNHADALHLMGVLAFQLGRLEVAEQFIVGAIQVKPTASYFGNLGLVLSAAGKTSAAVAVYRRAIDLNKDFAEAHNNLANILRGQGNLHDAIKAYRRAIECRGDFFEAHNNLGLCHSDGGHLDLAIEAFTRAIAIRPDSADTRNNLGIALGRKGEWGRAIGCWREALALKHDAADVHNNLGNAFKEIGRQNDAVSSLQSALKLQPNLPEAHNNLGVIYFGRGELAEAITAYRAALSARPEFADAHYNLAIALHQAGDLEHAIAGCRRALAIRPNWPEACNNLGIWLGEISRQDEALDAFAAAITARPTYAEAYNNRGNVFRQMGRLSDAIVSYEHAVSLRPDHAQAWNNLGIVLKQLGRMEDSISAFQKALALQPNLAEAYNNLANVLKDQGDLDGALLCYERAVELRPDDAAAHSNRVYTLYFHPDYSAEMILNEHRRWNQRHAAALRSAVMPHDNGPATGRRLRIGYVAPDFRDHCQSLFTIPLLSHHDHERFEIYCYSDVASPDAVTERLRALTDVWRNIAGHSDERVAATVRADGIDILVDLTMHMSHNRLAVFARKPAPVQVTWLGYPGTTGLETIDYRLSDPYLDPPGNDAFYAEKTIRLPDSFWCYDPLTRTPAVNRLPALSNGFVTFGCLNNFCKINDATLRVWARVMRAVPDSKLFLLAPEGSARLRVLDVLGAEKIAPARVTFSSRLTRRRYLELYHRIDLGLDTFPYNGHTTSLDSMWMGIPVITRVGQTAVSRAGFSQLSNLGFSRPGAYSEDEFVEMATDLANDPGRLSHLRSTLRRRLEHSPLMDGGRFAQNMEAAYLSMWKSRLIWSNATTPQSQPVTLRLAGSIRPRRKWARQTSQPHLA